MRKAWAFAFGLVVVLLAQVGLAGASDGDTPAIDVARMETPRGTPLQDILSGRAQPGFTPVLTPGFPFTARDGHVLWVRIRTELPADGRQWRLGVVRVPLDQLRLRVHPPGEVVARDGFFRRTSERAPWPATFELPLPEGTAGPTELYLELEGQVICESGRWLARC